MNPLFGPVLEIAAKVIEKVIPDKAGQEKAKAELALKAQDGALKELEISMSAIVAEAKSADPWTSRARPTFMYVFYALIVALVIVAPIVGIFFPMAMRTFFVNVASGFAAIPEAMWWTFSAGYLGYTGARTFEKQIKKGGK